MSDKIARLKSTLNNSKTQQTNNALYQTIFNLIEGFKDILNNFLTTEAFNNYVNSVRNVTIIEIDTSSTAPTLILADYVVNNFYIFKDVSGNAASNNITLTGSVEGVTDPQITTDYGLMRIYRSLNDGLYYQW